jgi:hypothetical protein
MDDNALEAVVRLSPGTGKVAMAATTADSLRSRDDISQLASSLFESSPLGASKDLMQRSRPRSFCSYSKTTD